MDLFLVGDDEFIAPPIITRAESLSRLEASHQSINIEPAEAMTRVSDGKNESH
jgi:hypothetical protein